MIIASIVIISIALIFSIYKFIKSDEKIPYFILIVAIFISSIPILYPYYIKSDDLNWFLSVIDSMRLNVIHKLQFPLRISYTVLYGGQHHIFYPLKLFYFPILFQLIFNLKEIEALNIFFLLVNLFSAFSMYYSSYNIFKNKYISLGSSILYVLNIYRLSDLYSRFAMGETFSFAVIPLLILSIYEIFFNNKNKWWLFVISASLIYQHHMLTTYLYAVLICIFFIIYIFIFHDFNRIVIFIKAAFTTLFLNSWLIFPQIYEFAFMDIINPAFNEFNNYTLVLSGLTSIKSFTNFLPSYKTINTIGFFMFFSFIFFILFLIFLLYIKIFHNDNDNKFNYIIKSKSFIIATVFLFIGILSYILTFSIIPYHLLNQTIFYKPIYIFQFAFRLFLITIPFVTLAMAYFMYVIFTEFFKNIIKIRIRIVSYIYICFLFIIASISSIYYINSVVNNREFLTFVRPATNMDYFLTNTLPEKQFDYDYNIIKSTDDIVINNLKRNYYNFDFNYEVVNYDNNKSYYIDMPLFDYPMYRVTDENGNTIKYEKGINNLLRIRINNDKGKLSIRQIEPLFWLIGDFISLITIICIAIYLIYTKIYIKKLKK